MMTEVTNMVPMLIVVGMMGLNLLLDLLILPHIKTERNQSIFFWTCLLGSFTIAAVLIYYLADIGWIYISNEITNVSSL